MLAVLCFFYKFADEDSVDLKPIYIAPFNVDVCKNAVLKNSLISASFRKNNIDLRKHKLSPIKVLEDVNWRLQNSNHIDITRKAENGYTIQTLIKEFGEVEIPNDYIETLEELKNKIEIEIKSDALSTLEKLSRDLLISPSKIFKSRDRSALPSSLLFEIILTSFTFYFVCNLIKFKTAH